MKSPRIKILVPIVVLVFTCLLFGSFYFGRSIQFIKGETEKDKLYPHDLIETWRKSKKFFGCYDVTKEMQKGFDKIRINDTLYAAVSYSDKKKEFRVTLIDPTHRIAQDDWIDSCILRPDQK